MSHRHGRGHGNPYPGGHGPHGTGVPHYGLLKGRATEGGIFPPRNPARDQPHYHIHVVAGGQEYDVAVNVRSRDGSELLYRVEQAFRPPHAQALLALDEGFHPIGSGGVGGLGLDFIRQHLVTRDQMALLHIGVRQEANPLHNEIDDLVQRAIREQETQIYAFGSSFRNNQGPNPFFGFTPDAGLHDIHMNQGNPLGGGFGGDNGVYQDGALLFYLPPQERGVPTPWVAAVFLAFQSQSWKTDDRTGDPR